MQILFSMNGLKRIFYLIILSLFLVCFAAFGYYLYVTRNVRLIPQKLELSNQRICVYDGDESPVTALSVQHAAQALRDIPKAVQSAFVSTEDKRFFEHNGFDYPRIAKAVLKNAAAHAAKQGASTISQQLVKNTHLTQEKTLKRKLCEWKLTQALEKAYSKEEILEKYLNVIYFGHDCFGIRSAAAFYFDKEPQALSLSDAAVLAGLVKSPNHYSPFKNAEACRTRKARVLNGMLKNGYITEAERKEALETPLPTKPHVHAQNAAYMHAVFDELSAIADDNELVLNGALSVYTYLDQGAQREAENVLQEYTSSGASVMLASPQTGGIKAYVSSVGSLPRSPGSLIKPLLVYAPCIEENLLSPATPILDEKIDYGGYSPDNYDDTFHGYVSAREALARSLNVPAVKLLETLGKTNAERYMQRLRLPVDRDDYSLAWALGGMKNGFTLEQLVGAYSALANGGEYVGTGFISRICVNGRCVYERVPNAERVFSEETSFLTTSMLQTAAQSGTAKKLRGLPFDIAAKTGTVGTARGNTDAYALTYTSRDVLGVWLGNADNATIDSTGGGLPCNFTRRLNEYLYGTYGAPTPFTPPKGVARVALDKVSYAHAHSLYLAEENAPIEYKTYEWFKKNAVPRRINDCFSNPSIPQPTLSVCDGKVLILLDEESPDFYRYTIEREDETGVEIIYDGAFQREIIDENARTDVKYCYYITPRYQNYAGERVPLPSVYITPQSTIPKDWWRS